MELTTIDDKTYAYLSSVQLSDLFPHSIFYPILQDELKKESMSLKQEMNEITSSSNQKMNSKRVFELSQRVSPSSLLIEKGSPVKCIRTLNNILAICGGSVMRVYNIENNYELINTYQLSENNALTALALTEMLDSNEVYCALGGESPVIRIINVLEGKELKTNQLIGHRNEIYELSISPIYYQILLSSSKDCTVRLWNIENAEQLVIFGGPDSHLAEVLSIDWHSSGKLFVSSGVDSSVKLYSITPKMEELIKKSIINKEKVIPLIKNYPYYSSTDIHDNYVDCVRFNGNFIISKSVEGVIKEWLPMFNKEGQYFYLINTYIYFTKEKIYNIKFSFDSTENIILIGNELGNGYLFEINELSEFSNSNFYYFFQSNPKCTICIKEKTMIRSSHYSSKYGVAFFGGENGEVFLYDLKCEYK